MGEIGAIWVTLGLKDAEFNKNLTEAQKNLVNMGDKFQSIGKSLTIAGAAITASMGLIIAKTANLGDQFYDLSQRTGIAVETLSSFKLAADKSGTSIGGFATGMKGLSRVMFEAASGGKEAQEAFKSVGVSATDSAGNLRPLDQVMLDVADRFASMADGAEKNALAMKLFGKSGMDLIPMLNLGRAGLEAETEAAKRMGLVMSKETAAACDAFNDSLTDLKGGLQGAGNQIAMALIPALTSLVEKMTGVIGKVTAWMQAHPLLTKVISGTVLVIGGLLTALGTLSFAIGTVLKQLPTFIKGLNVIKAIALNPIVITIAIAIPVLAKALSDFKKEFDNMRDAMQEAGKSGFIGFLEGVNSGWRKVALGIKDSNVVMSEANNKIISVKGAIILLGDAFRAIKGAIDAGATSVAKIADVFKDFGLKTRTELTEELKKAEEALKLLKTSAEATPGAIKALEDKIKALKESLYGARTETKNLTETLTPLARGGAFVRDVMQGFSGILTDTFVPAARDMSLVMAAAPASFDEVSGAASAFNRVLTTLAKQMGITASEFRTKLWNIVSDVNACFGISMKKIGEVATVSYSVADDMAKAFGEAFATIIRDGLTLKNFLKSLFQGIVNAAATFIGGELTKIFKKAFSDAATAVSSFAVMATAALAIILYAVRDIKAENEAGWRTDAIDRWTTQLKYLGDISDETAVKLQALSEKYDALGFAIKATGAVMADTGVDMSNFNAYLAEMTANANKYNANLPSVKMSWGGAMPGIPLDAADAADELSKQFEQILAAAKKFGQEGSKAMLDFILATRAAGLEVASVTAYVQGELDKIPSALRSLVDGFDKTGGSIKDMGALALTTFNAMIGSGMSWIDAVTAMKEPLAALRDKYKELGLTADPALAKLFKIVGLTEKHKELFQAIDANRTILEALGNSGWLTADAMKTLTGQSVDEFHKLRSAGLSVDDALRAMAPTLQDLVNYAAAYGITLDDATLSLIEQAKKLGVVKDAQKDIGTVTSEGFNALYKVLLAIAKVLGVDISGFMDDLNDKTDDLANGLKRVKGVLGDIRIPKPPGKPPRGGWYAEGGIAWTPQLAHVAERGPEIIMPLREYRADALPNAGGRSGPVVVNIRPVVIDKRDHYLIEFIQENLNHHALRVPTAVVGG